MKLEQNTVQDLQYYAYKMGKKKWHRNTSQKVACIMVIRCKPSTLPLVAPMHRCKALTRVLAKALKRNFCAIAYIMRSPDQELYSTISSWFSAVMRTYVPCKMCVGCYPGKKSGCSLRQTSPPWITLLQQLVQITFAKSCSASILLILCYNYTVH